MNTLIRGTLLIVGLLGSAVVSPAYVWESTGPHEQAFVTYQVWEYSYTDPEYGGYGESEIFWGWFTEHLWENDTLYIPDVDEWGPGWYHYVIYEVWSVEYLDIEEPPPSLVGLSLSFGENVGAFMMVRPSASKIRMSVQSYLVALINGVSHSQRFNGESSIPRMKPFSRRTR